MSPDFFLQFDGAAVEFVLTYVLMVATAVILTGKVLSKQLRASSWEGRRARVIITRLGNKEAKQKRNSNAHLMI